MNAITAITFLPLLGFLLAGLPVRHIGDRMAQFVTCVPMLIAAILAGTVFQDVAMEGNSYKVDLLRWIAIGDFNANWALRVDTLTAVMLVVVTWVSSVVHLYSIGYMSHDEHQPRFMAYLSLFTFCMLILVTADNFMQIFVGWEGVGLASYLLIGFWFRRDSANAASIKAFVVNRVGDFGFVLGILAIYLFFGTLDFDTVFTKASQAEGQTMVFLGMEFPTMTLICLLLFVGAMGKSAQLGLHTWLPDAMEGPTPVSALIHAATMVTAGVFLVARCSPLYELAPDALVVVTIVGACTAFFAATVGLVQNDIKKVIAYSTCSQLGYMFFACGVGAYAAAIFHLMTHAFFKALLFLGAGSVIHGVHDEQDMRRMGGLRKKMPVTYIFMWTGSLALAGIPVFAGYYSKDIILESAFAAHTGAGMFAFWMGIAAALMTAFYSWRLIFMTFHGTCRASHEVAENAHEASFTMNAPLALLFLGSLFAGGLGYHVFGMVDSQAIFWNGAIYTGPENHVLEHAHHVPDWVIWLPLVVAVSGILLAAFFYLRAKEMPGRLAKTFSPLYRFLLNKWYVDELYDVVFIRGAKWLGLFFWRIVDVMIVDGLGPNGLARLTQATASRMARLHTGFLFHYAFAMMLGLLALLGWLYWQFI
jgi:NADH-quinone oxidoreductase subunit L